MTDLGPKVTVVTLPSVDGPWLGLSDTAPLPPAVPIVPGVPFTAPVWLPPLGGVVGAVAALESGGLACPCGVIPSHPSIGMRTVGTEKESVA